MKKQYLFCCTLLLSTFCAQYSRTMQEQHNEPINQEEAQVGECEICNQNLDNPRGLSCGHQFCNVCVGQWAIGFQNADGIQCPRCRNHVDLGPSQEETEIFNQVVGSLNQQAQPVQPIQPEAVAPQAQPLPAPNIQVNQPLPQEQAGRAERFLRQVKERRAIIAGTALVTTGAVAYKFRKSLINLYTRTKANIGNAYRRLLAWGTSKTQKNKVKQYN